MNRWYILLLSACAWPAAAQIRLGVELAPSPALQHERVEARLNILNEAGMPLTFNEKGNARVRWVLHTSRGDTAPRWAGLSDQTFHELALDPAKLGTVTNVLNGIYRLAPGSYTLEACVEWKDLTFSAKRIFLEVIPGIPVAEIRAGAPSGGDRIFALRALNRDGGDRLFLRVEDPSRDEILGVFDLGRLVKMEKPSTRVDGSGQLHVLHQSSPFDYTYSVISPDARLQQTSQHDGQNRVIRLKSLQDGRIELHQGRPIELQYPDQPESLINPPRKRAESAP